MHTSNLLKTIADQVECDLNAAHAEICKLQGIDPAKHDWPKWSSPANTIGWLRALAATPDAGALEWQPIETAPKDGTEFLMSHELPWSATGSVTVAGWCECHSRFEDQIGREIPRTVWPYWQPLPAPPKES